MLVVGGGAAAFGAQGADVGGVSGERLDVEGCGFVGVVDRVFDAEHSSCVPKLFLCFVAAQEPDFLDGVVEGCCATVY